MLTRVGMRGSPGVARAVCPRCSGPRDRRPRGSRPPGPLLRTRRCGGSARRARSRAGPRGPPAAPVSPAKCRPVGPVAGAPGVPSRAVLPPWGCWCPRRASPGGAVASRCSPSLAVCGRPFGCPCRRRRLAAFGLPGAFGFRCPPALLCRALAPRRGAAGPACGPGPWASSPPPRRLRLDAAASPWYHVCVRPVRQRRGRCHSRARQKATRTFVRVAFPFAVLWLLPCAPPVPAAPAGGSGEA